MPYSYRHEPATDPEKKAISEGISEHGRQQGVVFHPEVPLSVLIYDGATLVGGAIGRVWADWLYVSELWVAADHRRRGLGTRALKELEKQARTHNVVGASTWTGSYEAPGFYEKHGYERVMELSDKPRGHRSFAYRKYF
jgi:GNAT superfamily N-acetyltransferase